MKIFTNRANLQILFPTDEETQLIKSVGFIYPLEIKFVITRRFDATERSARGATAGSVPRALPAVACGAREASL